MIKKKKKGLGRGLSALFGDEKSENKPKTKNIASNTKALIGDLTRNPYQPRQIFNEEKLEELANSIKKNGVIQPVAVRLDKSNETKYQIVAGERRWLAAQRAGLHEIPIVILDIDDNESLEVAIVENIQRDDLNVIEEANKFAGGIDIFCSNAGIIGVPGFMEASVEDWNNMWSVNVMSHIHAAKHVLPQMLERGEGYLVNTSSAAGLLTQIGAAGYAVTKNAAVSFAEWIKITYGEKGIGVSCLCPQAVRTAMTAGGPGVAGVDGMLEPGVVAQDVLDAIKEEKFLILPHKEVAEYVKRKGNDRDR